MRDALQSNSTRPYLIRALYEWCTDNGLTPFIAVLVDESVRVPVEYVKDGEIVLNISMDATNGLHLGNEFVEFKGRFGGVARDILVPVGRIVAIYARENGQGMAFPLVAREVDNSSAPLESAPTKTRNASLASVHTDGTSAEVAVERPEPPPPGGGRPSLTRIK